MTTPANDNLANAQALTSGNRVECQRNRPVDIVLTAITIPA